jgi:hypothetical protein
MKQLFFYSLLLVGICFSQIGSAQDNKTKVKSDNMKMKTKVAAASTATNMMMPYVAQYSSNFRMGDPQHGKMVLELWKDYDDNNFDRHADWFADTLMMILPDGTVVKGKEANLKGVKEYRNGFTSVKSRIDAWIPLYSVDRNESWVAVWGTEEDTDQSGKVTSTELQEIWRINKDGKIDFMKQFMGKTPMPQQ